MSFYVKWMRIQTYQHKIDSVDDFSKQINFSPMKNKNEDFESYEK